jgi:hypothetical protein
LFADEPHDAAADHHGDADAVADRETSVIDPADDDEFHVHHVQHERSGADERQSTTPFLHCLSPVDCCSCRPRGHYSPRPS